jgi:hypothetical protein
MPTTEPISVPAEAAKFAAFFEQWQRYSSDLRRSRGDWFSAAENAGKKADASRRSMGAVRDAIAAADKLLHVSNILRNTSEVIARSWTTIARGTANAARNIKEATTDLLRWAGLTSLVTGLVGAGGLTLFGIGLDRIGDAVSGRRTAALSTGASYGGLQSFTTNFGRLGDAQGILGRVSEAARDPNKAPGLRNLGLTDEDLQGDTADAAVKAIDRLARVLDRTDVGMIGPMLESLGLSDTFSTEQARALKSMSPQERAEMANNYRRDKSSMSLGADAQKRWQDFSTQMTRAGAEIENTFAKGLASLAGPLTRLSESFIELIRVMTQPGGIVAKMVDRLADGFTWLADHIDTDEFRARITSFMRAVQGLVTWTGRVLESIIGWATTLGLLPGAAAAAEGGPGAGGGGGGGTGGAGAGGAPSGTGGASGGTSGAAAGGSSGSGADAQRRRAIAFSTIKDQLRREGVPEANLDAAASALAGNAWHESGLNPGTVHDSGTGYGIYGAGGARNLAMQNWLTSHGYPRNSLEGQARYMAHEAMTGKSYARTREALRRAEAGNLDQVTETVSTDFERPGIPHLNRRLQAAREFHATRYQVTIDRNVGGNPVNTTNASAAGQ